MPNLKKKKNKKVALSVMTTTDDVDRKSSEDQECVTICNTEDKTVLTVPHTEIEVRQCCIILIAYHLR